MSDSEKPRRSWRERRQSIKHKWLVPFIFAEWLCERFSHFLEQWAFLDILEHAGRLTILVAVISYIAGYGERRMQAENQRKAKHYQAWQVINTAYGKPGNGGRLDALHDLRRDGVSLVGVDLSQSHLSNLDLSRIELVFANFSGAHLDYADLSGTELAEANFAGATLFDPNLSGAHITDANLIRATFYSPNLTGADIQDTSLVRATFNGGTLAGANLSGADLTEARLGTNLAGAALRRANLAGAMLHGANLTGVDLEFANLSGANLERADLRDIRSWQTIESIEYANIFGVQNAPDGFVEWAIGQGAVSIGDYREWQALVREKRQVSPKDP